MPPRPATPDSGSEDARRVAALRADIVRQVEQHNQFVLACQRAYALRDAREELREARAEKWRTAMAQLRASRQNLDQLRALLAQDPAFADYADWMPAVLDLNLPDDL